MNEKEKNIIYITLPKSMEKKVKGFDLDTSIPMPIQVADGVKSITAEQVTLEGIVAGMLLVLQKHPDDEHAPYYRRFVLAAQNNAVQELSLAAETKFRQKDYKFSEELYVTVYHLANNPESCLQLATFYTNLAHNAQEEKKDKEEDFYMTKALNTLSDGLEKFGQNELLLGEYALMQVFLGNLEDSLPYFEEYMKVAEEGEKKKEISKIYRQVKDNVDADLDFNQAYDYMMLEDEVNALKAADRFIKKKPEVWHGYFLRGWALRRQKRFKEAETALLECLKKGEKNADIYNELSLCAVGEGHRDLGMHYLEIAVDLEPENYNLVANLIMLKFEFKDYDEARHLLETWRKKKADDPRLKTLMEEYTKQTGEKFGEVVSEISVNNDELIKDLEKDHEHHHHDHKTSKKVLDHLSPEKVSALKAAALEAGITLEDLVFDDLDLDAEDEEQIFNYLMGMIDLVKSEDEWDDEDDEERAKENSPQRLAALHALAHALGTEPDKATLDDLMDLTREYSITEDEVIAFAKGHEHHHDEEHHCHHHEKERHCCHGHSHEEGDGHCCHHHHEEEEHHCCHNHNEGHHCCHHHHGEEEEE